MATLFDYPRLTMVGVTFLLLVAVYLGGRSGRARPFGEDERSQMGTIQGAILGVLALLLGFSFSMALQRYDTRRKLVVDEANAIGTTYLRADTLPDPARDKVKQILREYVDTRLAYVAAGTDTQAIADALRHSKQLQASLWQETAQVALRQRDDVTSSFMSTVNETIDLDAKRQAALANRIPGSAWLLLIVLSVLACFVVEYGGSRHVRLMRAAVPLAIASILALTADLDSPRRGFINVSQKTMVDLQKDLRK
ncbi:MAG TPA: hypothetical protein VNX88_10140 [Terriglobales bacterium]|jgi:hypothetical protein|nr:hypothetical protein [Terriglobales bacterium]